MQNFNFSHNGVTGTTLAIPPYPWYSFSPSSLTLMGETPLNFLPTWG